MRARGVLLDALAVIAETGWIYAGALVLATLADNGRPPSFVALTATAGLAFALVRLLRQVESDGPGPAIGFAVVSIVAIYTIARADFNADLRVWQLGWLGDLLSDPEGTLHGRGWLPTGVGIFIAVWVRNALRALSPITFDGVLRSFSIGFGVLLISIVAADPLGETNEVTRLLLPVFAANLLALALAHSLRVDVEGHGASRVSWMALVTGLVAVLVVVSLGLGILAEALFSDSIEPVGHALRAIVAALVYAISLPVFFIIYGILRLALLLSGRSEKDIADTLDLANQNLRDALTNPETTPGAGPPDWVVFTFRAFQLAVAVVILGAVLYLIYRRVRRASRTQGEERESVFSGRALRRDLAGLVGGLFRREHDGDNERPSSAIGRLYGDILAEAHRRGVDREPALTPGQFAPQLLVTFESRLPVDVTDHFAAFVYGHVEPPRETIARLRGEWRELAEEPPPT